MEANYKPKELKVEYTKEMVQDLKSMTGMDYEQELIDYLKNYQKELRNKKLGRILDER